MGTWLWGTVRLRVGDRTCRRSEVSPTGVHTYESNRRPPGLRGTTRDETVSVERDKTRLGGKDSGVPRGWGYHFV